MKIPQFRIGDLMVFAMVVAADIAAGRVIVSRNDGYLALYWLVATMPMAIVLQCTVLWLRSGRRGSYTFWIAALVSGTLALHCAVWNLADPPSETMTFSPSGTTTESYPGGLAARIWGPYQSAVYTMLKSAGLLVDPPNHWAQTVTEGVVYFVPQALVALSAGLIAEMIRRRLRGLAGISRSEDRIPTWLKQVASIAAVLVIAFIASGMPGWFGRSDHVLTELPSLPAIVDDLKFIELPKDAKPASP